MASVVWPLPVVRSPPDAGGWSVVSVEANVRRTGSRSRPYFSRTLTAFWPLVSPPRESSLSPAFTLLFAIWLTTP